MRSLWYKQWKEADPIGSESANKNNSVSPTG